MLTTRKTIAFMAILFAIVAMPFCKNGIAQSLYLTPDTIKICSGSSEEFDVELRADELVTGMNLYSVFINFDSELLELVYVTDTTFWKCNAWFLDSTCIDSEGVAWDVDSACVNWGCTTWEIVDSSCIDSFPTEWNVDSLCLDWFYEWEYDSVCVDFVPTAWDIDSNCLSWECTEWDEFSNCIDSICTEWQVDSTVTDSECVQWEIIDSTVIDSVCSLWDIDSTATAWECIWEYDSLCTDSVCTEWHYDSTVTAWECTEWHVDSTCTDSVVTTPESADIITIDTLSHAITEGPLMHPPEAQTVKFFSRVTTDLTKLIIESLIFWPRISVDGPGLLATIRMRNLGAGNHHFSIDSIIVLDVGGNSLPVSGVGNILRLNAPPDSFNLILPSVGQEIQVNPGDSVDFSWETSYTYCEEDSILYELVMSDSPLFPELTTSHFPDINATEYRLDAAADIWDGEVYWKVRAYTSQGFEQYSNLDGENEWYFNLDILAEPPGNFQLLIPGQDSILNVMGKDFEYFQWTTPSSSISNDTLRYELYIWLEEPIQGEEDMIFTDIETPETSVAIDSFLLYVNYLWRVKCINRLGLFTWSDQTFRMSFYRRGDANGDGDINVGDAVFITTFIFKNGPPPDLIVMGDANCDGIVNIGDVVYLTNYIFNNGPPPSSD